VEQYHTNAPMPLGALAFVGRPLGASNSQARGIAAATNALANNANLRFVQDWIRHVSVKNTVIYAQLTNGKQDEKARRIFLSWQVV
jgi:hypothetical protein